MDIIEQIVSSSLLIMGAADCCEIFVHTYDIITVFVFTDQKMTSRVHYTALCTALMYINHVFIASGRGRFKLAEG